MAIITIKEQDNSVVASGSAGLMGGIVLVCDKGRADVVTNIDSESKLIEKFGKPNPAKSLTHYSAIHFLSNSSNLTAIRAIHTSADGVKESDRDRTARYASALIRANVAPIPDGIPEDSYIPDRVVEPHISNDGYGLRQKDVDSFVFPQYARDREFRALANKITINSEGNKIVVNSIKDLKEGDQIALESVTEANKESVTLFTIQEISQVDVKYHMVKFNKPVSAGVGAKLRRVFIIDTTTDIVLAEAAKKDATSVKLNKTTGIKSGDTIKIGNEPYVVQSIKDSSVELRSGLVKDLGANTGITFLTRQYDATHDSAVVLRAVDGSTDVLFKSADFLVNEALYTFQADGVTNTDSEFTLVSKAVYDEAQSQLLLDKEVNVTIDTPINKLTKSNFEQRDVLLIYAENQGEWGNEVSVEIAPSIDYPNLCRFINVYYGGIKVESYEVSFSDFIDGLGTQMYVEDKINDKSSYIKVKHNTELVDDNGNPLIPAVTTYSLWRESSVDIFKPTDITLREDVLISDTDIIVSDSANLSMGDRIKFVPAGKLDYEPSEYKVTGKSVKDLKGGAKEHHITIDRPLVENSIKFGAVINKFNGVELKAVSKLDSLYAGYSVNSQLTISGKLGRLLDAGANFLTGGNNGTPADLGDITLALNKAFGSREEITINILLTGGISSPVYAQAISKVCNNRENTHGYLSGSIDALRNSDPVKAVSEFRTSLALDDSFTSTYPDYVKYYDSYNKKFVWAAVDGIAAACQSLAAEGRTWGEVAAGWTSGKLFSTNGLIHVWSEAEREKLLNIQLNPVKFHKTRGYSIWGNKTNYVTRSYLQMRNVRFILMQLNQMVREYMEGVHWTITDSNRRAIMVTELNNGISEFSSVLNGWNVFDTTTTQDEDTGTLRLYIGIQPKGVVDNINITFGIFSNSKSIEVSY